MLFFLPGKTVSSTGTGGTSALGFSAFLAISDNAKCNFEKCPGVAYPRTHLETLADRQLAWP